MRNLALKNKYFLHFRILLKSGRQASVGKGNFSHIIEASLKRAQRKQQEYNDIDWKISITETDQLSSLRVGELELYINHHNTCI